MSYLYPSRLRCALCTVVSMVCLAALTAPAWAQFETRATDAFPEGSWSIATGDFNHDGKLDVVMMVNNGFAVALGNGDGTFQTPVFYSTQLSYSLAVADFNNDGNLDIVVANDNLSPSTVSVYLGNGDGTFQTSPIISNTTSYNSFVVVGDFNGDGKPDIAVIDNPYISVLLGNGDGTFQAPSDNDSFVGTIWLAVADFNNDHNLDVLATGYFGASYSIGVLLGNGNGTLQNSITQSLEYVPATVAAGDLNGDGNVDAILGYDLDGIAIFLGNGDGSLGSPVNYSTTGLGGGYVMASDLNLNGKLDVVVPSGKGSVGGIDLFWGNGDGTLQPAQFFASVDAGLPAMGDLNGDHLPDVVMGSTFLGVTSVLNTGIASFSPAAPLVFPAQLFNTKSEPQVVTLTNIGTAALSIASIKVSGQFQASNTCGRSVAAGAKCTFNAVFRPKSAGTYSGLITLMDSASSRPQFIELTGSATVVKVSPDSLNFGSEEVGTKSSPQVVTITNDGSASLQFTSVYIGGNDTKDFSESNDCTAQAVKPGASCTVTVSFDPIKTGVRSALVYIDLPVGSVSPAPVALKGTGD